MATEKLTEDQLNWLRKHYYSGDWSDIAKAFNKEFGTKKSADAVRILWGRYKDKDLSGSEVPFADFTRVSFKHNKLNIKEGRYFVSGVMPLNRIDGILCGHIEQEPFLTLRETVDEGYFKPVLLTTMAHTELGQKQPNYYDPTLKPWRDWMTAGVTFNKHLQAADKRINPQQLKPLTGLKYDCSMIVATPKQDLEFINQGNEVLPFLLSGTGVLNNSRTYQDNRVGNLAKRAHKVGGLIVELKGDRFFIRQTQFDQQGGFYDLSQYRVYGEDPVFVRAEFIDCGDLHFGHDDEDLWRVLAEICAVTQPKRFIIQDGRDGYSHSRHIKNMPDKVKRSRVPWGASIRAEVDMVLQRMQRLKSILPKDCQIIFTDDNHGRFLKGYIDECRYMDDVPNFEIGHELQLLNLKERHLWKELIDPKGEYVWLSASQDFLVDGWQLANHGHLGLNGSKSNSSASAPKQIDAHGHTPFIRGDHWRVGHWSKPRHGYNEGPSSWIPSLCIGYPGGYLQQIIPIKAPKDKKPYEWRL